MMWPFGSKEKFSKSKVIPEGIQFSAPLDYVKPVSKAELENAQKSRPREEYEKGIRKILTPDSPKKFLFFSNSGRLLDSEILKLKENITEEDLIRVDADLEREAREAAESKNIDSEEVRNLEKIKDSDLIITEQFVREDYGSYSIELISGKIYGFDISIERTPRKCRGSLNGKNLSEGAARKLFEEYYLIAHARMDAIKKRAEENRQMKIEKELQPLKGKSVYRSEDEKGSE